MTPSFVKFHRYGNGGVVWVNPAFVEFVDDADGGTTIWLGPGLGIHVRESIEAVIVDLETVYERPDIVVVDLESS